MKVNETITLTHKVPGSAGYDVYPVFVDNLALIDITTEPPATKQYGTPGERHFTFLAVKEGPAEVRFAEFRRWELPNMRPEEPIQITVDAADATDVAEMAVAAGGWSAFNTPDKEALGVFDTAFQKLVGVRYDPLLVTKQLVNGKMNFIFLTNANLVYPNSVPYSALIRVRGDATEAEIVKIVPHGSPSRGIAGGYSAFREVSKEELVVFNGAIKGFSGSGFDVKYVSTQLVAGFNYKFAGTQAMTTKNPVEYPAFLTVYAPLSGAPVITGIEKAFNLV